jgi:hypothetical protein
VLDRQIKSFPSIDFREYPRGIDPINGAEITGLDSIGAAKGQPVAEKERIFGEATSEVTRLKALQGEVARQASAERTLGDLAGKTRDKRPTVFDKAKGVIRRDGPETPDEIQRPNDAFPKSFQAMAGWRMP